jgi:hypothetical protein
MKEANQNEQPEDGLPSAGNIETDSPDKDSQPNIEDNSELSSSEAITAPAIFPTEPLKNDAMEVHHHGHVHERRKWKEYVFQFFMLFLAVFCGFLAEYQLEQTIERHREKEYIEAFTNDLKLDTAQIQMRSRNISNTAKGIDSMLALAKDLTTIEQKRLFCYYYIKYVPTSILLVSNDGTMQQLKNAGGLRLIKNRKAVDSIMTYDSYNRGIEGQAVRYRDNVVKALDASDHIFDWNTFDKVEAQSLLTSDAIFLANPSKEELQYFINRVIKQKGVSLIYRRFLEEQYRRGCAHTTVFAEGVRSINSFYSVQHPRRTTCVDKYFDSY